VLLSVAAEAYDIACSQSQASKRAAKIAGFQIAGFESFRKIETCDHHPLPAPASLLRKRAVEMKQPLCAPAPAGQSRRERFALKPQVSAVAVCKLEQIAERRLSEAKR
jgi:hypothetical protein